MSKSSDSPIDLAVIRELIDLLIEKDVAELAFEREGTKVKIRRGGAEIGGPMGTVQHVVAAPAGASTASGPAVAAAESTGYEDCTIVTSPMVGTFYRSAEPGAEPFVDIGSVVSEGTTLCIVEAMKLMNEIVAESSGELAGVFVENGEPVEFGQRLFAIRPTR